MEIYLTLVVTHQILKQIESLCKGMISPFEQFKNEKFKKA